MVTRGKAVSVKDLSFSYGARRILEDISLDVEEGMIVGILGPNGCGKTTFLKHLNKSFHVGAEHVAIFGDDIASMSGKDVARIVGTVPQGNEIKFSFSVKEIVSMGRMPFQGPFQMESAEDEAIVEKAMEDAGIAHMKNRKINTMSGGERQRVIIARALAQTPRVILMDEPTLHLDVSTQFEILDLIERLSHDNGTTVIIVSHDLPLMARYCDKIAMFHERRLLAYGRTEDVLTSENMLTVFNVRADLSYDEQEGRRTVLLHGSARRAASASVTDSQHARSPSP